MTQKTLIILVWLFWLSQVLTVEWVLEQEFVSLMLGTFSLCFVHMMLQLIWLGDKKFRKQMKEIE